MDTPVVVHEECLGEGERERGVRGVLVAIEGSEQVLRWCDILGAV